MIFKKQRSIIEDYHEKELCKDKELVADVKQSMKEAKENKGEILKTEKEIDEYFEAL